MEPDVLHDAGDEFLAVRGDDLGCDVARADARAAGGENHVRTGCKAFGQRNIEQDFLVGKNFQINFHLPMPWQEDIPPAVGESTARSDRRKLRPPRDR